MKTDEFEEKICSGFLRGVCHGREGVTKFEDAMVGINKQLTDYGTAYCLGISAGARISDNAENCGNEEAREYFLKGIKDEKNNEETTPENFFNLKDKAYNAGRTFTRLLTKSMKHHVKNMNAGKEITEVKDE